MSTKLSRESFRKLIAEDLVWLRSMPRTLEREHIEAGLGELEAFHYDLPDLLRRILKDDDEARYPALLDGTVAEIRIWLEKLGGPRGS